MGGWGTARSSHAGCVTAQPAQSLWPPLRDRTVARERQLNESKQDTDRHAGAGPRCGGRLVPASLPGQRRPELPLRRGRARERPADGVGDGRAQRGQDRTGGDAGLGAFLAALALGAEVDTWDPRADRVSLLTLHAAKGLEFPVVFIVGCEDGLLPLRFGHANNNGEIATEFTARKSPPAIQSIGGRSAKAAPTIRPATRQVPRMCASGSQASLPHGGRSTAGGRPSAAPRRESSREIGGCRLRTLRRRHRPPRSRPAPQTQRQATDGTVYPLRRVAGFEPVSDRFRPAPGL